MFLFELHLIKIWISNLVPLAGIFLLSVAAYTDIRNRLIPNWISLLLIAGFCLLSIIHTKQIDFFEHLKWGVVTLCCLFPLFVFRKIGGGDVKLISVLTMWGGPLNGAEFIFQTTLMGAVLSVFVLSPGFRILWDWGHAHAGIQDDILIFPTRDSLPYAIAISVAGSVMILEFI